VKRVLYLLVLAAGLSLTVYADDWTGNLVDAVCADQKEKTVPCDATAATTVFALDVSGKIYKLDPVGDTKASAALKYHAAPIPDASGHVPTAVTAKITGTEGGGIIVVETISLQ
jgi:hypothetical protein